MSELKPCPFCGGEAKIITLTYKTYYAICHGCYMTQKVCKTNNEAIAAWNTRAERTCEITKKQEDWQYNFGVRDYEFSCGHVISWAHIYEPNYCPHCGAKVVGE